VRRSRFEKQKRPFEGAGTMQQMMDLKQYIESGILHDYCLGVLNEQDRREVENNCRLYPELKAELAALQNALNNYMETFNKVPQAGLRDKIWRVLDNINNEEKKSIDSLPLINKFSDYKNWLHIVKPVLPEKLERPLFVKVIRDDDVAWQSVIWTKADYPDEVHDDVKECFIVLEGECECHIGNEVIHLKAGGYLDIPLHTHHDVKVISEQVLAVVQRLKVS